MNKNDKSFFNVFKGILFLDVYKKQLLIDDELSKEVFIHLLSNIIQLTKEQKKIYQKQ